MLASLIPTGGLLPYAAWRQGEEVYLYPKPVDFRKSIDGLSALVEDISNWSKLVRYTEGGHLPIDNNSAER